MKSFFFTFFLLFFSLNFSQERREIELKQKFIMELRQLADGDIVNEEIGGGVSAGLQGSILGAVLAATMIARDEWNSKAPSSQISA